MIFEQDTEYEYLWRWVCECGAKCPGWVRRDLAEEWATDHLRDDVAHSSSETGSPEHGRGRGDGDGVAGVMEIRPNENARFALLAEVSEPEGDWLLDVFEEDPNTAPTRYRLTAKNADNAITEAQEALGQHYALTRDDPPGIPRAAASWRLAPLA